jgi:antitoxin CptB
MLRAGRRGMREADLILGPFAASAVPAMGAAALRAFEALLDETDRDILAWVTGQAPPPAAHAGPLAAIAAFTAERLGPPG